MRTPDSCCEKYSEPVYFTEEEEHPFTHAKTGRVRTAVSHIQCEMCGYVTIVDGEYGASSWRNK
jgi:hypothetical protein